MIRYALGILALGLTASATAQTTPTTATVPAGRALPANTLLTVTPTAELSSKKLKVGDTVAFVTIGDVSEQGTVVIPRGAAVKGEITFKTGKAVGGKSGKFEVTFKSVQVGNTEYQLTGTHRQEGKGNTVAAVFATWLVSGRSATMTPGQEARAFTAAPIPY